ncbi:hypothetical protein AcW1_007890 [Taiwanofungus camphoratus]|nr:hypothetical protein AcW2_007053 [Antrodia cinnamomea]KAI0953745.1 hypothetical protein AcW1_007890 [Antrodia cinnamomea]
MMKSFFVLASLVAASVAQNINIATPVNGSTVSNGQNITVEIDRPNSLTGSQEVAVVIAINQCPNNDCSTFNASQDLGEILYNGSYRPVLNNSVVSRPPSQNFTVQVPSSYNSGDVVALSVTHLALVGAGPEVMLEVKDVSLNID